MTSGLGWFKSGKNDKIDIFLLWNRILLFEYFTHMKNVIFWDTSSWCSSKIEFLEGGSKAAIVDYECPLTLYQIFSYIYMMYLKRSHFSCRQRIQTAKFFFVFEKTDKNSIFYFALFHIGALCSKTLGCLRQALEWWYQNFVCIFPNITFYMILNLA